MAPHRSILPALVSLAGTLACAAPAGAATTFSTAALGDPARSGLAVSGALSDFVATSNARVVAPSTWQRRSAPAGRLRFTSSKHTNCVYDLTYSVKSVLGAPGQSAAARVAAGLPAASARYLLDSGTHGNRAFSVVRKPSIGGRVRVDALWAGVLTKRDDIAPGGQVAWTEIRVVARSRAGSECHSGTWRESLGPAIGDSLAVARTKLRFTRS